MSEKLLDEVLALPRGERLELAEAIYQSVEPDGDFRLSPGQRAELEGRLEAARANPLEGSSWAEARARIVGTPK